jgi:hypothetical protein
MLARQRHARLAQQATESTGETSVLPLAQLASAVEVLDLDDLLAGEELAVAAAARRQLEEPTNVDRGAPDTLFPLPPLPAARAGAGGAAAAAPPRPAAPAVAVADRPTVAPVGASMGKPAIAAVGASAGKPAIAAVGASAGKPAIAVGGASAGLPAPAPVGAMAGRAAVAANLQKAGDGGAGGDDRAVPVRELALAWFEARGYRSSSASQAVRPIELVLRHQKDPGRAYAFVVESERVTSERVATLLEHARSIGLTRILVAAESGFDADARHRFRRQGLRLVDQIEMRREFDKLDLRVAAKIIAVARNRAKLRKSPS